MEAVRALRPMDDPLSSLPFVHETLSTLRREIDGSGATLLGFIGTPWTLAAYSVEVGGCSLQYDWRGAGCSLWQPPLAWVGTAVGAAPYIGRLPCFMPSRLLHCCCRARLTATAGAPRR